MPKLPRLLVISTEHPKCTYSDFHTSNYRARIVNDRNGHLPLPPPSVVYVGAKGLAPGSGLLSSIQSPLPAPPTSPCGREAAFCVTCLSSREAVTPWPEHGRGSLVPVGREGVTLARGSTSIRGFTSSEGPGDAGTRTGLPDHRAPPCVRRSIRTTGPGRRAALTHAPTARCWHRPGTWWPQGWRPSGHGSHEGVLKSLRS